NFIVDEARAMSHDDLCLLTTNNRLEQALYRPFGATSAASALAACFAARLLAELPHASPETIRALIVHSADWTPAMLRRVGAASRADLRELPLLAKRVLLRRFGYGVPSLDRALYSAQNDLTLVVQDSLFPYERRNGSVRTREMHVHPLPWPRDMLLELGEAEVEMRVTLSYFIEPRPGDRGWKRRYQYASHGLRFDAQHPLETEAQFRARLSRAARAGGVEVVALDPADRWNLHTMVRNSGSIHSDTWRGTAAELAQRSAIGIFPVGGWWKDDVSMRRYDLPAAYSLVVSIRAPEQEIDLYSAVEAEIAARVRAVAEIEVEG
ncbi:MAG: S8 family serine peptidase, partial [Dehalococcoidia bacterium]